MSKEAILEESLRLFGRHGYDRVSLQQIADAVSLHKSSLFHHFPSKQAIAETLAVQLGEELESMAKAYLKPENPKPDQFLQFLKANIELYFEQPAWGRYLASSMIFPSDDVGKVNPEDKQHPVVRFFLHMAEWLYATKKQGLIKHDNLPLALVQSIALIVGTLSMAEVGLAFGLQEEKFFEDWAQETPAAVFRLLGIKGS